MGINTFLPTRKIVRQWSDRRKKVEVPLFPNYVFVNIPSKERSKVFAIKGIIKYVSMKGEPCKVSSEVIDSIKIIVEGKLEVVNGIFCEGEEVIVYYGPIAGLTGKLVEKRGRYKVCVRVEALNQSILVEVSAGEIGKVSENRCVTA